MTLPSKYDFESVFNMNANVCLTLTDLGGLYVSLNHMTRV